MLSKEFFAALFLIALLAAVLGGVIEGAPPGASEDVNMLQTLMAPIENFATIEWFAQGPFNPIPKVTFPWTDAFFHAVFFDTALFEGFYGGLVKWGLWALFGIPIVIGLGMWVIGVIRGSG